jgi:hypothetical protein
MGELINLRRARKSRLRTEKDAQASENRMKFGLTRLEKTEQAKRTERESKALDGHRLSSREDQPAKDTSQ